MTTTTSTRQIGPVHHVHWQYNQTKQIGCKTYFFKQQRLVANENTFKNKVLIHKVCDSKITYFSLNKSRMGIKNVISDVDFMSRLSVSQPFNDFYLDEYQPDSHIATRSILD